MRHFIFAGLLACTLTAIVTADDRERRIRVALALSGTETGCHMASLPDAQSESLKTGKPLLIFVNVACDQRCDDRAVVTEVPIYGESSRPRIVVVSRGGVGESETTLYIRGELPAESTNDAIEKATDKGLKASAGQEINWFS